MKDADPRTIRLVDYAPPRYRTDRVSLHFDIRDGETRVTSVLSVRREGEPGPLELDGDDLRLVSVRVNGVAPGDNAMSVTPDRLVLTDVGDVAEVEIVTRIVPEKNTALSGLYKSRTMYATQCEAEGFRRITYYQDRPDVLARFTTTVQADATRYPVLLSNGNLVSEREDAGRRIVTWEDPFPKPAYLFALVAGDLAHIEDHFVTMSGRRVVLRIYSEPHNIDQCDYAMDVLKRCMRWDEEVFGREYDLDIFMIVAVEDFNMGAMENKGLNIFNTSCVLASPDTATDLAYQRVEAVVAHEYFHNWSGNRVTCRDWFQLSLKEGFTVYRDAEFSSDMNSRTVKRIEDVQFLRSVQFTEDAGPLAHPIRPASYIEISNFYTVTVYEKGAEIVRMLRTLLGADGFRAGSDDYFATHDGQAATTDDFVAAMQRHAAVDLTQFQRWYSQAGTPIVNVAVLETEGELALTIAQRCPPSPGQPEKAPFHIPMLMGLVARDGAAVDADTIAVSGDAAVERRDDGWLVHLREPVHTLRFRTGGRAVIPSLLRGFSAPVRLEVARDASTLALLALHDSDGFARWDALQSLLVEEIRAFGDRGQAGTVLVDLFAQLQAQALAASTPEERFLLATMLTCPDEAYLFEAISPLDVDAVCDAVEGLRRQLGERLLTGWRQLHAACVSDAPYSPDAGAMAGRALANVALGYLVAAEPDATVTTLLSGRFEHADNLTDRRAALTEICFSDKVTESTRQAVLAGFLERFRDKALVVDAWFAVQAASPLTTVAGLETLEQHEAFDVSNPNKVRALYSTFAARNFRRFHAVDGSGYRFLADRIVRLNATNPQIASRLTTELTRFRRYDSVRQRLMRAELERIAAAEGLSRDVFEVVTKSLAG
ncbi:MAG: aminopeptidase N [Pseudomonadales bacterium]|nr:aminopeptidase N [Pseudomonadales bacterium]